MFGYYDPTYFLLIPGILLALFAQFKVSSAFNKWKQVPSRTGLTGSSIARMILDANGAGDVRIERVQGSLTDHYDPSNNPLRLSDEVYASNSVAALGVAAHEAGHAIQDARDYAPLRIRSTMAPVANIGSTAAIEPMLATGTIVERKRSGA